MVGCLNGVLVDFGRGVVDWWRFFLMVWKRGVDLVD